MSQDAVQELEAMKKALTALEALSPEGRARAVGWLSETLGVGKVGVGGGGMGSVTSNQAPGVDPALADVTAMTPKEFMALKKPTTDVERIACLAYYLHHGRDTAHFKTKDLTALNTEAAGLRFSNASQAANNALTQNGYLAQAGKGNRQIAPRGEALVEALPDREAVTAALAEHPKRARRKRSTPKVAKK